MVASCGVLLQRVPGDKSTRRAMDALVLLGFVSVGGVVQVPGLGGGMQVATIVALTKIYQMPFEAAPGWRFLFWVVSSSRWCPLGLACAFHEGINWSKLKLLSAKQILEDAGGKSLHMTCPFCGHKEDRVIDSRESKEGDVIRRRRQCLGCERRFTTYERSDEIPYMVVKKDGRREKFDRQKVLNGLLKACEKRPVSDGQAGRSGGCRGGKAG